MSGEPEAPMFDDDFIKGASFTEPSARERARRPGRLERRRIARAAGRRTRRDGSRMKTAVTVLAVVVAMALVGALAWKVRGGGALSPETASVKKGPVPAIGAANPFEGSPAASYADGAAGIVPPPAKPVGAFSARNVVAAYANTGHLLAASALDRQTLLGGSPDAFAAAVGPDERPDFVKRLNDHDTGQRTRGWLVTFAPHTAELVGRTIKVDGGMSAHPVTLQGAHGVGVRFDYLFVYPIQRPGAPRTLERLVARVSGEVFYYLRSGTMHIHIADWSVSPTPARCDVRDGFIHPSYGDSAPEKAAPSGRPLDPYDRSDPEPKNGKCLRSTGT
ncbi:hypothetical protein GCM10027176_43700 [Actinoallomurus bryophytorum]|uniref:Uncharacterized protein n=1 Tax=Actinoallomurus bryophytorum TaxID=1490222 RepID=A0A543CEF2_9ACTN|nr:hypothetical protein [Actinoallomurus bryophytorum]TQL95390.1 hypothetical protein FB559_0893 [Actinoallomurus bryophytorum]